MGEFYLFIVFIGQNVYIRIDIKLTWIYYWTVSCDSYKSQKPRIANTPFEKNAIEHLDTCLLGVLI
jgi:hypothetical protein